MKTYKVLVIGCGNMGASHARAYHQLSAFELVGLVSRGPESREKTVAGTGRRAHLRHHRTGPACHYPRCGVH
ncbi:Gfo/Idh/MocA family oxidoreductase [Hymenobacter sp. NBH84]|uniref:Gfo/Idh/MocA family oxidoreductase n=1 Tax=Hymenobacter sp. NBH84 TaxID=2596915 RepID=UPI0027E448C7|nr:Gfo/Idh/MocA family oxidoreductase [Hymenobacter sp. NBH84]